MMFLYHSKGNTDRVRVAAMEIDAKNCQPKMPIYVHIDRQLVHVSFQPNCTVKYSDQINEKKNAKH